MTVEVTTKYATTVNTVQDAFVFVMEHLDDVVGSGPSIHISPFWIINDDNSTERQFEVSIQGMIERD